MNRIDEEIRAHYADKALPEARVEAILRGGTRRESWRQWLRGIAAAAAVVVVAAGLYRHNDTTLLADRVFAEVALNHRKNLAVEVEGTRLEEVQQGLDRLDFSILSAAEVMGPDYALVGGRYCSIQGELAAQLKVVEQAQGRRWTVYVVPLNDDLAAIVGSGKTMAGVRIELVERAGMFLALAVDVGGRGR